MTRRIGLGRREGRWPSATWRPRWTIACACATCLEGISARLSGREREAAVLCYLHGFSRAQAAARMGVSEPRMRKLMEGRGPGRPGVAGKVGALVQSIRDGDWCEEQGSLMRGFAFGILDPDGERYRLARVHRGECPACRAYVASLRGLAGALPPVLLPWGLGAGALAQLTEGAHVGSAAAGAGVTGATGGATGAQLGRGLGGTLGASAGAGAGAGGAAGGGWLLAGGPLGAKLAVGCLLALGVGAGCVALGEAGHQHRRPAHRAVAAARHLGAHVPDGSTALAEDELGQPLTPAGGGSIAESSHPRSSSATSLTSSARASREFGPEQAQQATGQAGGAPEQVAHVASATAEGASGGEAAASGTSPPQPAASTPPSRAEREFSPG